MSRKIKNICMTILLVLLVVLAFFTVNYSRNDFRDRGMIPPNGELGGFRGEFQNRPEGIPVPSNMENGQMTRDPRENSREFMRPEIREPRGNNLAFNILLGVEAFGIFLILMYLIMSKFNNLTIKETFSSPSQIIIYIVAVFVLTALATILTLKLAPDRFGMMPPFYEEEEVEKDTKATDVNSGEIVAEENINLAKYNSNITINKAGNYTLEGEYKHSILVNADGEVVLNLNDVIAKNNITAAIANISNNSLIINLPDNTTNILTDGGSSEYDACIYSKGPLTITGNGSLGVYGKQSEGEGIATESNDITINGGDIKVISNDDGINAGGDGGTIEINGGTVYIKASGDGIDSNKNIVINGGSVYAMGSALGGDAGMDADEGIIINGGDIIALGSDMLEKPKEGSLQKFLAINLPSRIEEGEIISLKNEKGQKIASFRAGENFRTLIISNEKIEDEKYILYKNGEKVVEI